MAVPSLTPLTPPDPIDTQNEHPWRDLILSPRLMFSTGREWQGKKRKTDVTKTIPVAVLMVLPRGLLRGTDADFEEAPQEAGLHSLKEFRHTPVLPTVPGEVLPVSLGSA